MLEFSGQLTKPDRFSYHTGYGEPPAGSSQLHSMTLAAPGRGELRLRPRELTEGHRIMTDLSAAAGWVELHPKILAAVSCTPRPWLHPTGTIEREFVQGAFVRIFCTRPTTNRGGLRCVTYFWGSRDV